MLTTLFDHFPEAILHLDEDRLLYANPAALRLLPRLEVGGPVPPMLALPLSRSAGAGFFSTDTDSYTFSCSPQGDGALLFFRPALQSALTGQQLEDGLQLLRALMGDLAMELGPHTGPQSPPPGKEALQDFVKTYHRLFRLMADLDHLHMAGTEQGVPFQPALLSFDTLCTRLFSEADSLLQETGRRVRFTAAPLPLLLEGDRAMLTTMLTALLAAIAGSCDGEISVQLRRQQDRALLELSAAVPRSAPGELPPLLRGESVAPGGSGLSRDVARHIVSLHQGALLTQWDGDRLSFLLSLPPTQGRSHTAVESPLPQGDGGLSPLLVGLSDLLPASLFGAEGLE